MLAVQPVSELEHVQYLYQDAKDMRKLSSQFLACKSDQVGAWDHGNVGECEDEDVVIGYGV